MATSSPLFQIEHVSDNHRLQPQPLHQTPTALQPSLRLYGRTWRISTDMVPAIAVLTSTAHALFLLVFGVLWFVVVPPADAATGGFSCPAALHYDIFMFSLLVCFGLMLILELALIYAGMKGEILSCFHRRKGFAVG